ncbi:uncharacterized protein LOC126736344 [Anthonomus grandis grandis]|uniref:uncharacterized protein LOC126736344 n=1 Tax=Anthonomus grandis grandis TaxID=2921223 RepID=UPI002165A5D9|nr:uncharacterized protein LOC126736344 [Anthonomus grandis grandis]
MPETSQELNIDVSNELILTPFTGASLVNEVLKWLLFQKCQIPYGFNRLKHVVEKRRKNLQEDTGPKKHNFKYENHFRTVSTAYDSLDLIMRGINKEFSAENNTIQEVMLVFGSSTVCPKEVFSIVIPSLAWGHMERNHINGINKHVQNILKNLFHSQTWMDSIDATIPLTNTYVYLKKQILVTSDFTSEPFEFCEPLHISSHIKHSKCVISYVESKRTKCCELNIFDDGTMPTESLVKLQEPESGVEVEKHVVWCKAKEVLKGFKECYENKVSVCELW